MDSTQVGERYAAAAITATSLVALTARNEPALVHSMASETEDPALVMVMLANLATFLAAQTQAHSLEQVADSMSALAAQQTSHYPDLVQKYADLHRQQGTP